MGSEVTVTTEIFFKDKTNELKGPFTERQVQEWYRKGWFENSFPFYFMNSDNSPDDSTPLFTLDELCTRNGIGAPFIPPSEVVPREEIRAESEQRLICLEQAIRSLRVKCEDVLRVKARIEEMEEKLKTLSAGKVDASSLSNGEKPAAAVETTSVLPKPSMSSSVATKEKKGSKIVEKSVEQRDKKRETELRNLNKAFSVFQSNTIKTGAPSVAAEVVSTKPAARAAKKTENPETNLHVEWANEWLEFYLDCLGGRSVTPIQAINERLEAILHLMYTKVFKSKEATEKCREVMIGYFKKLPYFYCATSDVVCLNYKQTLLLLSDTTNGICALWEPFLETLIGQECRRYSKLDAHAPNLHPTITFIDRFTEQYRHLVYGNTDTGIDDVMFDMFRRLARNYVKMMTELHEHIGDNQTSCINCCVVTGTREEYYKHMRTHAHLRKVSAKDLITLVVNMSQKIED